MCPWKEITDIVKQHDGKSHDTDTCGMHVHFNRTFFPRAHQNLYTLRLVYLFEKFYDEICVFSRRKDNRNARKYERPLFDRTARRKIRELRTDFWRYQAVNLRNNRTIEIRTFRGTLKVDTILATLEFVNFLVKYCKKTSTKKLQILTWSDLTSDIIKQNYKYLPDYLRARGLLSNSQPQVHEED